MISAQPVKNRIMNLSQDVADLLQNPKCFSTCSTHHRNCVPNNIDLTPFNAIQNVHPEHGQEARNQFIPNGAVKPIDCEHPKPVNEGVNPFFFNNQAVRLENFEQPNPFINNGVVSPVQIEKPEELNEAINPACPNIEAVNPVHHGEPELLNNAVEPIIRQHGAGIPAPVNPPGSFNNLGYFVNLGTFINKSAGPDTFHPGHFPEPFNPNGLNPLGAFEQPVGPIPCHHPGAFNELGNQGFFRQCPSSLGAISNLFNQLNCFDHRFPPCHDGLHNLEKFDCSFLKSKLFTAFELVKGSVRALPLRMFRKKEILDLLDQAEKMIVDAFVLSVELITSVLSLLQLASLKVTLFTERRCTCVGVFSTSTQCSSNKNFFSTQTCSFR